MSVPNGKSITEDFEFLALSEANNYRKAIVGMFAPFLRRRVLEVGAGIGQITERLCELPTVSEVVGIEPDQNFREIFRNRLPRVTLHAGTTTDLDDSARFDAAVMVNVLEHIEADEEELARLHAMLSSDKGYLCILVPARQEIFAPIDAHFGHFRRYNQRELDAKLKAAGFKPILMNYFNFVGYFLWFFNFKLRKIKSFNPAQVRFFDRVVFPPLHWAESKLFTPPIGQSLIAVARAV